MFFKKKRAKKAQLNSNNSKHRVVDDNKKSQGKSKPKRDHGIKERKPSAILTTPRTIMLPRLLLIASVIFLCVIGIVFVYSASSVKGYVEHDGDATYFVVRQIGFMFVSLIPAAFVIVVKYTFFDRKYVSLIMWIMCVLALGLVLIAGVTALGAERAFFIGPFAIQPAEFTKITLMLFLSHLISEVRSNNISTQQFVGLGLVAIFSTIGLVAKQPDLGTLIIICVGVLVLLILGGFPILLIVGIIVGALLLFVLLCIVQPYHLDRIRAVIDPYSDPDGSGYQLIHSLYAFGTGGIFGTGLGTSRQKYLYLPEAHTDFIFAIIGEEAGLIGAFAVLLAFAVLVYSGLRIAYNAPDRFGCLVAGSLTSVIGFQACVNMACVVGLAPITGKPLPFLSYGGSSLISSMTIAALILSVSLNSSPEKRYESKRDKFVIFSKKKTQQASAGTASAIGKASTQAVKASNKILDTVGRIPLFSNKKKDGNNVVNTASPSSPSRGKSTAKQKRELRPEQKGRISYNREKYSSNQRGSRPSSISHYQNSNRSGHRSNTSHSNGYRDSSWERNSHKSSHLQSRSRNSSRSRISSYDDIRDNNIHTNNSQSKARSNGSRRKSTVSRSFNNRH